MPRELLLPELAESVVEGEILKWLVSVGDDVSLDQPVVEVMTDKVTVELPSPFAGKLVKRLVNEGDVVAVHAPIALFADEGAASVEENPNAAPPPPTAGDKVGNPTSVPEPVTASELVTASEPVTASEERSIIEAGGSLQEEDAGDAQSLFKAFGVQEEIRMPVRAARATDGTGSGAARAGTNEFGRVLAVPAARKLARDLGLDIAEVPGSGPNGRVRVADVRAFADSRPGEPAAPEAAPARQAAPPGPGGFPGPVPYRTPRGYESLEERVPLRGLRRAITNQMLASHLHTVRTLTVDEVDLTRLVGLRSRARSRAEQQGVKLSYLPFIFKAAATALRAHPSVNSSLDDAAHQIVLKRYYNLGLAVAADAGLVVPVVRDVDKKSIMDIARDINHLAGKARDGKLALDEMTGGTFSITNIGSIGALFSFPIINVPDAAILGVHSLQERPVVRDGQIVVRSMMYLSLSFDHRLVDGADAARFTRTLIRLLEDPETLLLEGI